jgi:hypothetical protein
MGGIPVTQFLKVELPKVIGRRPDGVMRLRTIREKNAEALPARGKTADHVLAMLAAVETTDR